MINDILRVLSLNFDFMESIMGFALSHDKEKHSYGYSINYIEDTNNFRVIFYLKCFHDKENILFSRLKGIQYQIIFLVEKSILYAKITVSPKKFVSKPIIKYYTSILFS